MRLLSRISYYLFEHLNIHSYSYFRKCKLTLFYFFCKFFLKKLNEAKLGTKATYGMVRVLCLCRFFYAPIVPLILIYNGCL